MKISRSAIETAIRAIIPGASFDRDNYGQIIIYTDLMPSEDEDGILVDFVEPEEDSEDM